MTTDGLCSTEGIFDAIEREATTWLRLTGTSREDTTLERSLDVRYVGQNYAVTIPLPANMSPDDVKRAFDAAHQLRYSHSAPEEPAEIIATRVSIIGVLSKPQSSQLASGTGTPSPAATLGRRNVRFSSDGDLEATIFNRHQLLAGDAFDGPAIVQEDGSATVRPSARPRRCLADRPLETHGERMITSSRVGA